MRNRKTAGPATRYSRRELLKMAAPLGKVTLVEGRCTGCGLCAIECPTGALAVDMTGPDGGFQLLFRHGTCLACGQCLAACPEKCLNLERTVAPDRIEAPPIVLFTDEIVYCPDCGRPVAPRAMIDAIKAKVGKSGGGSATRWELCPDCRLKTRFSLSGK